MINGLYMIIESQRQIVCFLGNVIFVEDNDYIEGYVVSVVVIQLIFCGGWNFFLMKFVDVQVCVGRVLLMEMEQ